MSKTKKIRKPKRPTVRPNALIPLNRQGQPYRIEALTVRFELTYLNADGTIDTREVTAPVGWFDGKFKQTAHEFIASHNLAIRPKE